MLAGVADLSDQSAQKFADEFDTEILSLEAILSWDIDGVCVVTAAPSHADLAIKLLKSGKAVYVENRLRVLAMLKI